MPIYEYECRACGHRFEQVVLPATTPACPECQGQDLERLLSMFAVDSEGTRQTHLKAARKQAAKIRREQSRQGTGTHLQVGSGPSFIGCYGGNGAQPDIGHFCLGVENFDPDRVTQRLGDHGVQSRVRMRDDTIPELYFQDPDGITVQLQDVSYCGGSGRLGNQCL